VIRVLALARCVDGYCGRKGCCRPATSQWIVLHTGIREHTRVRFCTDCRRLLIPGQYGQGSAKMLREARELAERDREKRSGNQEAA
jgi:hypothetical protein